MAATLWFSQIKYGGSTPFPRLEQLEKPFGIPLLAATQWEIVEQAVHVIRPARDKLVREAGQGDAVRKDDTSMRVLCLGA